jgi:methionyl-tRNA formyltransferase
MLKTCFFGTSDRSDPILGSLDKNSQLLLCITKHDVLVGRNHELKETGVKSWSKEHGKEFIEIGSLKEEDLQK